MKKIPLTQGKFALVDDDDFDELMKYKWHVSRNGYAVRNLPRKLAKSGTTLMHRFIFCATNINKQIDHVNGNKLDNTRSNLRVATNQQNSFNRGRQHNNKSGFKGVCWDDGVRKWRASIRLDGFQNYLGIYDDKESAYSAYMAAAKRCHGEFIHP